MAKKKEPIVSTEDKFYNTFTAMTKTNFLGHILKDYFGERLIGKDAGSVESLKLKAIIRILEEKFSD